MADDQRAVIAFLGDPAVHGAAVERVTTHISELFLVGERVYKLKRAVRFPYIDFSTVARRRAACEAEVAVNRRTAPALYLGLAPIRADAAGRLTLGALGESAADAVDWVVVLRRFDQSQLFDRLAARGALTEPLIDALTERIAAFHRSVEPQRGAGGAAAMRAVLEESLGELAAMPRVLPSDQVADLARRLRESLAAGSDALDRRAADGRVRRCHGDLHLRNICLIDGEPTLFDAIEFSDALAVIDVLYDLAFLVMDLLHRGLPELANRCLNGYLERCDELDGVPALAFLIALRAVVRAKIAGTLAGEASGDAGAVHRGEAGALFALAENCLARDTPRLVALGGLSGSGKTTFARRLAPMLGRPPGALILRSDVIRKQLAGVAPETRLDAASYGRVQAARVYDEMRRRAERALGAGCSVLLDAVHARAEERAAATDLARRLGLPFNGLWLTAESAQLTARVAGRTRDASDATEDVIREQLGYDTGAIEWAVVDTRGLLDEAVARACALLSRTG